jgi:hypothetical protein
MPWKGAVNHGIRIFFSRFNAGFESFIPAPVLENPDLRLIFAEIAQTLPKLLIPLS